MHHQQITLLLEQNFKDTLTNDLDVYIVGGFVRDMLLGDINTSDIDYVVVGSNSQELIKRGFKPVGKHFPVFLHPITHSEYALARTERKTSQGHCGFDLEYDEGVTLADDLSRRDITINAIALDRFGKIIDPFNGVDDLKHKIVKHVSRAFTEDPLRVLRAARIASKLNFTIASETISLLKSMVISDELSTLSKERIWDEVQKSLASSNSKQFFIILDNIGASKRLFPQLCDIMDFTSLSDQLNVPTNDLSIKFGILCYLSYTKYPTTEHVLTQSTVSNYIQTIARLVCMYYENIKNLQLLSCVEIYEILNRLDPIRHEIRYHKITQIITIIANAENSLQAIKHLQILDVIINKFRHINYQSILNFTTNHKQTVTNHKILLIEECLRHAK